MIAGARDLGVGCLISPGPSARHHMSVNREGTRSVTCMNDALYSHTTQGTSPCPLQSIRGDKTPTGSGERVILQEGHHNNFPLLL